jgi:uncharacterized protein
MTAPVGFHVLAKPTGAICNLDCAYCFFLSKEDLYPGDTFRMGDDVLEAYLRQLVEAHVRGPAGRRAEVTVAWQGGEPTLMGLGFFRRAMQILAEVTPPGVTLHHTIQTNGTRIDDDWCDFLSSHGVLVGLSIDGPRDIHDTYRVGKRGEPTFDRVLVAWERLAGAGVDTNVLCTVHAANESRAVEVYRFFRDDLGARHVQFIPIVERDHTVGPHAGDRTAGFAMGDSVTDRSVSPGGWGRFLCEVFDEWVVADVGRVFVQMFDAALAAWLDLPSSMCIFAETCGDALALEHNGDLYSCDHFVEPRHLLGNIMTTQMVDLVASPGQRAFGEAKRDTLPAYCRACEVRFACNGECPKNRFTAAPDGEPGLNYLCAGYRRFFGHVDGPMRIMAAMLRSGRHADEVMGVLTRAPRNEPCPCGSGLKAKRCHAR